MLHFSFKLHNIQRKFDKNPKKALNPKNPKNPSFQSIQIN